MIEAKETLIGNIASSSSLSGSLNKATEYIEPITQEKVTTPTKEQQVLTPDDGYTGLSKVTVDAIPDAYTEVSGEIDITTNGEYDVKSYEKAKVNVEMPKITSATYLFYGGARTDAFEELIGLLSDEITDFRNMFNACKTVTEIPKFNTSNGTMFNYMFNGCSNIKTMFDIDLSKAINCQSMFGSTTIENFPNQLNTSKCENFSSMFSTNNSVKTIPILDTSNGDQFGGMFSQCRGLTTVPELNLGKATNIANMFGYCGSLTTLGALKDLGKAYQTSKSQNYSSYTLNLSSSTLLTHESLMNVINGLYDIASLGVKPQTLNLGATNLAKLTAEEIAIATNKGWTVQ